MKNACNPNDLVDKAKKEIFDLISLNKTLCGKLPNLEIPNLNPSSAINNAKNALNQPSLAVIDFLSDIIAVVSGINFDGMKMQLINWLVEQLQPLAEDLSINLSASIKKCYACKVNPVIPGWLFVKQPGTVGVDGSEIDGVGLNIEISKVDLFCFFGIDPNSEAGKLVYDGNSDNDITRFMWDVIQQNGGPLMWKDPDNSKEILEFRYYENNGAGYIETDGTVEYQNIEERSRVFNVRIPNSYQDKTIITVLADYFNSQNPLFNPDKLIPSIINLIYGTITNKLDLPTECVNRSVEVEQALKDYIESGIDDEEIVFDNSFYTFTTKQRQNIKEIVKQRQLGVSQFKNCCGKKISTISFETLKKITEDIETSPTLEGRIETYTRAVDTLIDESVEGVLDINKNSGSAEFLAKILSALQIALGKIVLSPKSLLMVNLFIYLLTNKPLQNSSIKELLKQIECILRDMLSELLRKLIYEFLLPLVINALKNLIVCVLIKKLKEKNSYDLQTYLTLLPPFISQNIDKINGVLGDAGNAVKGGLSGNFNSQFGLDSKFCK
tara:strand:+ start:7935 stop:9596 length:1662 start_codon:yes stop_codon:yes gene_type:complete